MKNLKLSTELASSVLGLNVVYIESCEHRDNIIGIWTDMNTKPIKEINIYEFAFKCKEWALNKGFNIFSSYKSFSIFQNGILICSSSGENAEIEAIIKACEWILEDLKKKI